MNLDALSASYGFAVGGALGYEVFSKYVVEIDYKDRSINILDSKAFKYNGNGVILPVRIDRYPFVMVAMVSTDRETIGANAMIDTGSNAAISLTTAFASRFPTLLDYSHSRVVHGQRIDGEFTTGSGHLPRMILGGDVFESVPTDLSVPPFRMDAIIGAEVLRNYRVFVDYPRSRFILERTAPINISWSPAVFNFGIMKAPPEFNRCTACGVGDSGAAFDAGLRDGDVVTSIGGVAIAALSMDEIGDIVAKHSEIGHVQLVIKSDDQSKIIEIDASQK